MLIAVAGERLEAYGDVGGPCLLIHGAGEAASIFAPQISAVAGTWAVDLPGHGASPGDGRESVSEYAELVRALLEDNARTRTVLGGHSMGGAIALEAALTYPEMLSGLALIATGARLRVHPDLLRELSEGRFPASFREMMVGDPDDVALLRRIPEPSAPAVRHRDFLACDAFDVLGRLSEISLPTLAITGSRDRYTPDKYGRTLAQETGGRFILIPDSGHLVTLERPAEVNRALQRFLRETVSA